MALFEIYAPILVLVLRCYEEDYGAWQQGKTTVYYFSVFPSSRHSSLTTLFGALHLSICVSVCGLNAFQVLLSVEALLP